MKRVRLTNESINYYGTWVVTAGIDLKQYERNPVLLYMHKRGEVIGQLRDIKQEGDALTAELDFDEASELSRRCKMQFEKGSLRMVSVGLDIIETSSDKKYIKSGQSYPTITKSKLFEVSLVDIGANDDAIVLKHEGKVITLGANGEHPLPQLKISTKNKKEMTQEELAVALGLPKDATEEQINQRVAQFKASELENQSLKTEKEQLLAAAIEDAVKVAIEQKRLSADLKDHFVELGKIVGVEKLKKTFAAMPPVTRLSHVIGHQGGVANQQSEKTYTKLSDMPADEQVELKKTDRETYARLYKEEYGVELDKTE